MFERQDSRWLVTVLNHKKETDKIIITYWMPNVSEIRTEAIEMEFEIQHGDYDGSDMADNFFARLIPLEN